MSEQIKEKFKGLLRKTERYTETDMVYVTRQGFWSLMTQVVVSGSSAVTVIVMANVLPKEIFGQYRFILSIVGTLVIFAMPGITTAFMRSVARGERTDVRSMVWTEIRWGFLGSLVALLIGAYYFWSGDAVLGFSLIIVAALLPFSQSFSVYSAYYKGKQDFRTATIYDSISFLFRSAALIAVVLLTGNVLVILGTFLIGQVVASAFFYVKTLRDEKLLRPAGSVPEEWSAEVVRYGKQLTGTQVVATIAGNLDKLLVGYVLGPGILAAYSIALTIPSNAVALFNVIPRIAFPKFSRNEWGTEERKKIVRKLFVFLAALIVPAVLYFLLVPFVLPFIFRGYRDSVPAAVMLALLILISPLNAVVDQVFQARKLVKNIVLSQTITMAVFVAVFFAMFRALGADPMAAAAALVASEAVQLLVGIALVRK